MTARALDALRPHPVAVGLPTVPGRLPGLDAGALAGELSAMLPDTRARLARIAAGELDDDDAAALAWLAVDCLALAERIEPRDGWRAARMTAEAAAESGGATGRAHVVTP